MASRALRILVAAAVAATCGPAAAKDLGAYGATFEVVEQDLLALLSAKLKAAEASGRMAALNRDFVARAKARLNRPAPVADLSTTQRPRSWLFDPSITVPQDFADGEGRVFARKGDVINPLDRIPGFNRVLVFIDGDDPRQLAFAVRRVRAQARSKTYVVLTAGAPLEVMRRSGLQVFFDQGGVLSDHFGLAHVPAVVAREGRALRVSEVLP